MKINIPISVPSHYKADYIKHYKKVAPRSGRLMLFAGDQKIEHLNSDFHGKGIASADGNPEHLFRIASQAQVGVFAAQLGLIANYGADYKNVNYLVKLNSKTDIIPTAKRDPQSALLNTVEQVVEFKKHSKLKIVGIGFTLYPGSAFEAEMMAQASQAIYQAHSQGLLAVLWIYLRGQSIKNPKDAQLLAGAAGIASALGADFVKLNYPDEATPAKVQAIVQAGGRTKVIFSGGEAVEAKKFLKILSEQIKAGAGGSATGRNVHQKDLAEAIRMANAITAIVRHDLSPDQAYQIYQGKRKLPRFFF